MRVGFFLAEHGSIDKGDGKRNIFDKLVKEFLPVVIAVGATLILVIVGICYFYCATLRRKAKIKKMSREELANAAQQHVDSYRNRLEKKNERAR